MKKSMVAVCGVLLGSIVATPPYLRSKFGR